MTVLSNTDFLVAVAERIGRGDLSVTVPVVGRDEIGQLAETFNDSVRRLRALVLTEAERDAERRKRDELQRSITRLLDTAVEIARGDPDPEPDQPGSRSDGKERACPAQPRGRG